jgi:hypothetical protein
MKNIIRKTFKIQLGIDGIYKKVSLIKFKKNNIIYTIFLLN